MDTDTELGFSDFLKVPGAPGWDRCPWLCPSPCLGQQDLPMALQPMEQDNSSTVCVVGFSWAGIACSVQPLVLLQQSWGSQRLFGECSLNQRWRQEWEELPLMWSSQVPRRDSTGLESSAVRAGRKVRHGWNYLDQNHLGKGEWTLLK